MSINSVQVVVVNTVEFVEDGGNNREIDLTSGNQNTTTDVQDHHFTVLPQQKKIYQSTLQITRNKARIKLQ